MPINQPGLRVTQLYASEIMGLTAGIHAISRATYAAAQGDDSSELAVASSIKYIDLDKAWHAIHYLLTGNSEHTFLLTGTQIEGVSEHCELHSPDSLRSLQLRLGSTSVAEIMSGFRCDDFNDRNIYPCPGEWTEDMAPYVAEHLERFLKKLREMVDGDSGMIVVIW
jgi:hypothetical protein